MWLMLQQPEPDDYVVATGEAHSVEEAAAVAFTRVGLDWRDYVHEDPALRRPAEVDHLIGSAAKARERLGWQPGVGFKQLIELMVDADLESVRQERLLASQK